MPATTNQNADGPGGDGRQAAAGGDCRPQGQADGQPAPRVLRADHVQLNGEAPGLPFVANGVKRRGWLVLTDQGEFRFYDKELPAMTKAPALRAATADQFVRKVTRLGVLVRFGKDRYNMGFTGEPAPERRSAEAEEKIGDGGELVSNVGSLIAGAGAGVGQVISTAGDMATLAVDSVQLYRLARNSKRRAAAKAAWYPVLRGTRAWHQINEAEAAAAKARPVS
jgi:hypothetical protein